MSASHKRPAGRADPAPLGSRAFYLHRAGQCRQAAEATEDPVTRALHDEEAQLWLALAEQRLGIEAVLARYLGDAPPAGAASPRRARSASRAQPHRPENNTRR